MKFLDFEYIRKFLVDCPLETKIEHSCNATSNSVYIFFYKGGARRATLRISDHFLKSVPETQFIITLNKPLTKKREAVFKRTVNNCVEYADYNFLRWQLRCLSDGMSI